MFSFPSVDKLWVWSCLWTDQVFWPLFTDLEYLWIVFWIYLTPTWSPSSSSFSVSEHVSKPLENSRDWHLWCLHHLAKLFPVNSSLLLSLCLVEFYPKLLQYLKIIIPLHSCSNRFIVLHSFSFPVRSIIESLLFKFELAFIVIATLPRR